jgi:hypothetical protein
MDTFASASAASAAAAHHISAGKVCAGGGGRMRGGRVDRVGASGGITEWGRAGLMAA